MEQIVANNSKPHIIIYLFSRPEDGRWGPGHSVRFPLFSTRWIWSSSSSPSLSSLLALPSSSLTSSYLSSLCFIIYVFKCTILFLMSSRFRRSNMFAQVLEPSACLRRKVQTLKGNQCRILVLVSLEDFGVETDETICNWNWNVSFVC